MAEMDDYSDIYAKHAIQQPNELESIVVLDGMPVIGEDKQPKLYKALRKTLSTKAGVEVEDEQFYMPLVDGKGDG